jgi:hypothetical protein
MQRQERKGAKLRIAGIRDVAELTSSEAPLHHDPDRVAVAAMRVAAILVVPLTRVAYVAAPSDAEVVIVIVWYGARRARAVVIAVRNPCVMNHDVGLAGRRTEVAAAFMRPITIGWCDYDLVLDGGHCKGLERALLDTQHPGGAIVIVVRCPHPGNWEDNPSSR